MNSKDVGKKQPKKLAEKSARAGWPRRPDQPPAGLWPKATYYSRRIYNDIAANEGGPKMDWRTLVILLVTPVLLTIFYYFGRPEFFRRNGLEWAVSIFGADWEYVHLAAYAYWALASLVLRVFIPLLIIVLVLKHSPKDYGYRVKGSLQHVPIYLLLLIAVMPLVYLASTQGSFQDKYPFYDHAHLGGWHLWGFEFFYFIQFFSLEAFFRGFLIFGLFRRFGYYAVLIMVIPYCMIHFNKPFTETIGAIFAGFALGVLALRSGSFLLGVLLHYAVALAMDLLALYYAGFFR